MKDNIYITVEELSFYKKLANIFKDIQFSSSIIENSSQDWHSLNQLKCMERETRDTAGVVSSISISARKC